MFLKAAKQGQSQKFSFEGQTRDAFSLCHGKTHVTDLANLFQNPKKATIELHILFTERFVQ